MTDVEQRTAAKEFVQKWQGKGYEKGSAAYTSESACVGELMKLYQKKTAE